MKNLVILIVIAAVAGAVWFFKPWEKDADTDSDPPKKQNGEPGAVALHSAETELTVADATVDDLKGHIWKMTGRSQPPYNESTTFEPNSLNTLLLQDKTILSIQDGSVAFDLTYQKVNSISDQTPNKDGKGFLLSDGEKFEVLKLGGDELVLNVDGENLQRYKRATGEEAQKLQAVFDKYLAENPR